MEYGKLELAFSIPFVEAVECDAKFRDWVISRTPMAVYSNDCKVLNEEMITKRPNANYYWRSFYTEKCRCSGCSGQETDILSIFESDDTRFSLHVEVKQPTDNFKENGRQAESYPIRAACWANSDNGPKNLVPHEHAATALLCSDSRLPDFSDHLNHFDTVITFEEITKIFPNIYPSELLAA